MMAMVLPANLITASVSERLGAPQTIALACMITAAGCVALLPMASGTSYGAIGAPLIILGGGLGLLVPSLTSTLLGSVEKSRSGIAAGVLNATRQTGSVLGVALFGSLVAGNNAFMAGAHASLVTALAGLSDAGARYFAERVAEACYGSVAVNHRVLDLLEELGVRIPPGFKP